jgi:L-amino acid N-acyltransferase YncA
VNIRPAVKNDLPAITEIYNEAILNTVATFDTQPKTVEEQEKWFASHDARHPILVAEENGVVIGWASLSIWSDRCAYSDTAEASLYVRKEHRGRGVGRKLSIALLQAGEKAGLHTVLARVTEGNKASLRLAQSAGFERVGTMREVGRKFGHLLDVHLLQRVF